jgi:hypothetical protein
MMILYHGYFLQDCQENFIDVFNQQKDFFLQKNNQYGYELIDSISIKLSSNSDKIKLELKVTWYLFFYWEIFIST